MTISARSVVMSGMALATASVVAVAPSVSPVAPDFARGASHEFSALPVRADEVVLTGAILDLVTNATVAFINLYYPIRDLGQAAINVANAIVYNPYIQIWPITAWMSQINAAWYLGRDILDPTPPGAGTIDLLVDLVKIPQDVLHNGSSLGAELSELADLTLNALNYGAAYLINYGFYQLSYFTWIWIKPINPPLFPLFASSTSVDFRLPGFLVPNNLTTLSTMSTETSRFSRFQGTGVAELPRGVKDALAPIREAGGLLAAGGQAVKAAADEFATGVGNFRAPSAAIDTVPRKVDRPIRTALRGVVAAQGEVRGAARELASAGSAVTATGDRAATRKAVVEKLATDVAPGVDKAKLGLAEPRKDIRKALGGHERRSRTTESPAG